MKISFILYQNKKIRKKYCKNISVPTRGAKGNERYYPTKRLYIPKTNTAMGILTNCPLAPIPTCRYSLNQKHEPHSSTLPRSSPQTTAPKQPTSPQQNRRFTPTQISDIPLICPRPRKDTSAYNSDRRTKKKEEGSTKQGHDV